MARATLRRWNGTTFKTGATLKRFDGSALRAGATLRRWDGAAWVPSQLDVDAAAFLTAAAITDPTIVGAIDTLTRALKTAGLWTKLKAIYPFVGGTAFTHKFSLKDPRDLDAAFRLSFNGSWVHSASGARPTNAYADTHFVPSVHFASVDSGSLGFYSRTSTGTPTPAGPNYDMGCSTPGDLRATIVVCNYWTGATYLDYGTATYPNTTGGEGRGLFCANRLSSTVTTGYRNGAQVINQSDDVVQPNFSLYIGANNTAGTASYFSTKQCAFAFIGDGLTPTEHANLYAAVQDFETTLGRRWQDAPLGAVRLARARELTLEDRVLQGDPIARVEMARRDAAGS